MPEEEIAQAIAAEVERIMTTPGDADPWIDEEAFRRGKQAALGLFIAGFVWCERNARRCCD